MNEVTENMWASLQAPPSPSLSVCFLFCKRKEAKRKEGERPWLHPLQWQLSARFASGAVTHTHMHSFASPVSLLWLYNCTDVRAHTHTHGGVTGDRELRAPAGVTQAVCQVIASTPFYPSSMPWEGLGDTLLNIDYVWLAVWYWQISTSCSCQRLTPEDHSNALNQHRIKINKFFTSIYASYLRKKSTGMHACTCMQTITTYTRKNSFACEASSCIHRYCGVYNCVGSHTCTFK